MTRIAKVFFLIAALFSPILQAKNQVINIGVLAYRGNEKAQQRWQPTADYLSESITGYDFVIKKMNLSQLSNAVEVEDIDFVITNPGQFVSLGNRYGLSWLATLKSRRHQGKKDVIGSALIVKASSQFTLLQDLKNQTLGAVSPQAFGGFQTFLGEMSKAKLDPQHFFKKVIYGHYPVDAIVYWVRDGMVDAAIIPACLMEKMADEGLIDKNNFRVLHKKSYKNFTCAVSSELYPNWSFAKLRHSSPELAQQISLALYALDADSPEAIASHSKGWTGPVSTFRINRLFQRLNIDTKPYSLWEQVFMRLLELWPWLMACAIALTLGGAHHVWVQMLVKKRSQQLADAHIQLRHQERKLEHVHRVSLMGEMASGLAHELNQPLAAIHNYSEGGLVRLRSQDPSSSLIPLFEKIRNQSERSSQIIHHMRCFVKKQSIEKQKASLSKLINETVVLLEHELQAASIKFKLINNSSNADINMAPVAIQQVIVNLLRNSIDAIQMIVTKGVIEITIDESPSDLTVTISDNGIGLAKPKLDQLFHPFFTTKDEGLGLGMSICQSIIEEHDGNIWAESNEPEGLKIAFTLHKGSD